jgi:hypothetical protein
LDLVVSAGLTALPLGVGFLTGFFDGTSVVPWGGLDSWWNRDPRWARYGESPIISGLRMGVKRWPANPRAGPKKQNRRRKRGRRGWPTTDSAEVQAPNPPSKGGGRVGSLEETRSGTATHHAEAEICQDPPSHEFATDFTTS